jgi:hypothetical protein
VSGEVVQPAIPGELTETSLTLPQDLPRERWAEIGRTLRAMERGVQFWVGDWLAFGEDHYGEEAFAELERADKTLANWATVARKVHPSRRREDVRFSHHAEVTSLPPEEQTEVLGMAAEGNWVIRETREEVERRHQERAEREFAATPEKNGSKTQSKVEYIDEPECPSCGAAPDHWQRIPAEVSREH